MAVTWLAASGRPRRRSALGFAAPGGSHAAHKVIQQALVAGLGATGPQIAEGGVLPVTTRGQPVQSEAQE